MDITASTQRMGATTAKGKQKVTTASPRNKQPLPSLMETSPNAPASDPEIVPTISTSLPTVPTISTSPPTVNSDIPAVTKEKLSSVDSVSDAAGMNAPQSKAITDQSGSERGRVANGKKGKKGGKAPARGKKLQNPLPPPMDFSPALPVMQKPSSVIPTQAAPVSQVVSDDTTHGIAAGAMESPGTDTPVATAKSSNGKRGHDDDAPGEPEASAKKKRTSKWNTLPARPTSQRVRSRKQ
ncbi:hypothetical protein Hypma_013218 [Hypsizygus marmoreus]|uniref:Uncharacterized protein n=1 Tax=Hypsizygus marmoreus TaxID=39966 RepID=A0A369JK24_HYPMA|nr:hypothetical protein Hypma_013218 [Hypsizygus marmoreus]